MGFRFVVFVLGVLATPVSAAITVSLTSAVSSPQPVGTSITFTATASDTKPGTLDYQFSVAASGQPFQVLIDYSLQNTFMWTPGGPEGAYAIQVVARNKAAADTATAQAQFAIQSRVIDGVPVVSDTAHPLVALFSSPACPAGSEMYVVFFAGAVQNRTDQRACDGQSSMNFYIGGMLPNTTYSLYPVVVSGTGSTAGPTTEYTTGAIPANLQFPPSRVVLPPSSLAETGQNVLLIANSSIDLGALGLFYFPTATDLSGNVIWYYSFSGSSNQTSDFFIRPVDGGTMMVIVADTQSGLKDGRGQLWREIDLAGNTIRQTNVTRVSEQLVDMGLLGITDFDHDSIRLPNGHTLILCSQEKIFPAPTQGSTRPVDVIGNAIVDLDENLQVGWSWSAYDHMDVNRAAILREACAPFQTGCVPVSLASAAADWLHGNSLSYNASTGDILLSLRHQDWIVRIDYSNGSGTGAVLWELGKDGSFTIDSTDPYPWFSHQHDAEYEVGGTTIISLFDDGNTRVEQNPGLVENSRGMALIIDEATMTVTPILSQDLGLFSPAVGSAQRLNNGNFEFDNGYINPGPDEYAQHVEYTVTGAAVYKLQTNTLAYRDYRMGSLYAEDELLQVPSKRSCLREAGCRSLGPKL